MKSLNMLLTYDPVFLGNTIYPNCLDKIQNCNIIQSVIDEIVTLVERDNNTKEKNFENKIIQIQHEDNRLEFMQSSVEQSINSKLVTMVEENPIEMIKTEDTLDYVINQETNYQKNIDSSTSTPCNIIETSNVVGIIDLVVKSDAYDGMITAKDIEGVDYYNSANNEQNDEITNQNHLELIHSSVEQSLNFTEATMVTETPIEIKIVEDIIKYATEVVPSILNNDINQVLRYSETNHQNNIEYKLDNIIELNTTTTINKNEHEYAYQSITPCNKIVSSNVVDLTDLVIKSDVNDEMMISTKDSKEVVENNFTIVESNDIIKQNHFENDINEQNDEITNQNHLELIHSSVEQSLNFTEATMVTETPIEIKIVEDIIKYATEVVPSILNNDINQVLRYSETSHQNNIEYKLDNIIELNTTTTINKNEHEYAYQSITPCNKIVSSNVVDLTDLVIKSDVNDEMMISTKDSKEEVGFGSTKEDFNQNEFDELWQKRKLCLELSAEDRARQFFRQRQRDRVTLEQAIDLSLKEYIEMYERAHAIRLHFEEEKSKWLSMAQLQLTNYDQLLTNTPSKRHRLSQLSPYNYYQDHNQYPNNFHQNNINLNNNYDIQNDNNNNTNTNLYNNFEYHNNLQEDFQYSYDDQDHKNMVNKSNNNHNSVDNQLQHHGLRRLKPFLVPVKQKMLPPS